ncbi:phosphatidate cytidylyltransferase [Sediminibacterium soli]|uniref:phosphatidate cytidylyltransferase n=1 Tax=Sediminibacterium soli TaxID=2698829 RepID=UPI00137AB918|nr:phosphatidate cytidylyltransferase [Sediminibacterium soli]NCI47395.1 phosphatidate cytidylyltransferase [Sediminibacterium soli]
MKIKWLSAGILSLMFFFLSGCRLIGDIFKAGVWTGILLVAAIIGLIVFLIGKMGKKG